MKHPTTALLLACGLALMPLASAWGQEARPEPYELVRTLRALQDRAAQGDDSAHGQQRRMSAEVADQLLAAPASVWDDPRNVRAIVMYALGGGEPRVLKALFARRKLPGVDERLLNGALAYSEGRDTEAAELLAAVDARTLEPHLGAHVALVRSALLAAREPQRALELLDEARLLAPGTLIEEAALRRQAAVLASSGKIDAYSTLAAHYMRRFPNSVYAKGFREQFAMEVSSERYGQEPEQLAKLEQMVEGLDPASRRRVYLLITHHAVVGGRVALARLATRRAVALTDGEGEVHTRARIYEAAILVVTEDYDTGLAALQGIDRAALEESDAELLDAAKAVADEVRRPLVVADQSSPAAAPQPDVPLPSVVETARKVMARVDVLLNEVPE